MAVPEGEYKNEIEGISYGKNKSEKKTSNLTKYNRAGYFSVAPLCDRFPDFQCVPGIPHTRFLSLPTASWQECRTILSV